MARTSMAVIPKRPSGRRMRMGQQEQFDGVALIQDPIHDAIQITTKLPGRGAELAEDDLIDSPWLQRLRRIHQLQSTWWVYPTAEHTRFQHSVGTMHLGGIFAQHLYPDLKRLLGRKCPSFPLVQETVRLAGLLHDVGHGPFGHFFDDNYLDQFHLTHEDLSRAIIRRRLAPLIRRIRRSPLGRFAPAESVNPAHLGYLIKTPVAGDERGIPLWVQYLRPLLSGVFTVDNLDYVQRDAYMCGIPIGPLNIPRLLHYLFISDKGLTLHRNGLSLLQFFLNARFYLYTNVYFHRTVRAIDLQIKEIFRDTMHLLLGGNPLDHLDRYLHIQEWTLFNTVSLWVTEGRSRRQRELGRKWRQILKRNVRWKMACQQVLAADQAEVGQEYIGEAELKERILSQLPPRLRQVEFHLDMPSQNPKPLNPFAGPKKILVYDPAATPAISEQPLSEIYRFIPAKHIICRVFATSHEHDREFARALGKALQGTELAYGTNI